MKHYDIIFAGSGLAAHMTLLEMIKYDYFKGQSILMIDAQAKTADDRTWCYWEHGEGAFDHLLFRSWGEATFCDQQGSFTLNLAPYRYKMIRSSSFYLYVQTQVKSLAIEWLQADILGYHQLQDRVSLETKENSFTCNLLLSSLLHTENLVKKNTYPFLQQHFIGWFVKTDRAIFNSEKPVFMDFSVEQRGNTRFMYLLPVSECEALIEYTLFSHKLLPAHDYEQAIHAYVTNQGAKYEIIEKEQGAIPMTCYRFSKQNTKQILHIGSAGGWTKASTGYTFKNTMKQAKKIAALLAVKNNKISLPKNRFWYYDLLLLDILDRKNEKGQLIFSAMFRNASPALIFKFLDEETTFWEDLQVIWSCPKQLFIKALLRRLLKR